MIGKMPHHFLRSSSFPAAEKSSTYANTPTWLSVEVTNSLQGELTKAHIAGQIYGEILSATGKLKRLLRWWIRLLELVQKFGYFPKPTNSWLKILKILK